MNSKLGSIVENWASESIENCTNWRGIQEAESDNESLQDRQMKRGFETGIVNLKFD